MPNSTKSKKLAAAKGLRNLWRRGFAPEGRMPDRQDAFCIAAWLARADRRRSGDAPMRPRGVHPS